MKPGKRNWLDICFTGGLSLLSIFIAIDSGIKGLLTGQTYIFLPSQPVTGFPSFRNIIAPGAYIASVVNILLFGLLAFLFSYAFLRIVSYGDRAPFRKSIIKRVFNYYLIALVVLFILYGISYLTLGFSFMFHQE